MKFGEFHLHVVSDGKFRLDGGAMFGVVPRVLWERTNPPDAANRILLGLNCLLIKSSREVILVDTGIGTLYDEKFAGMFQIDHSENLHDGLKSLGLTSADVTRVILTHLHFDHCGGNCVRGDDGTLNPAFPNATYYVQKGELEYAKAPDPRSKGSYLAHNWEPVEASGQLQLISGDTEIVPGVQTVVTGGHTRDHQIVKIQSDGKIACFLADLVPTNSHLRTPYVMGYDLYPKTTMEVKEKVLKQAVQGKWLVFFEHAPSVKAGYLFEKDGRIQLEKVEP
ncbi:MAG: MBL fold metallo-hydrolase [Calditrichaeota bacterium]|nr:MAG: MBL fold metallo-hydrolase [Calditrichota bacterium]